MSQILRRAGFLALVYLGLLAVATPPALAKLPPGTLVLGMDPGLVAVLQIAANTTAVLLLAWAGLAMGRPLGFAAWRGRAGLVAACGAGAALGVLLILLDYLGTFLLKMPRAWSPLRGSLVLVFLRGLYIAAYAGLFEEIVFRLFLMTLLARLAWALRGRPDPIPAWIFTASAIVAGLAFGAAHLPAASRILPFTPVFVLRTVTLNLLAGLLFAWLYWRRTLAHAIAAHFSADVVLYAIWPFVGRAIS